MGSKAVIDLLSSDDEVPVTARERPRTFAPANDRATADRSLASKVRNDTIGADEQWEQVPFKRRRLSLSPASKDGKYVLPQLPRPGLKLPPQQAENIRDWATLDGSDPIVFTSSLEYRNLRAKRNGVDNDASDDSLPEDIFSATTLAKPSALSARTAALLEGLAQPPPAVKPIDVRRRSGNTSAKGNNSRSRDSIDEEDSSSPKIDAIPPKRPAKTSKKSKLTEEAKAAQTQEKEHEKASKVKQKENTKAASKEQKAKEKEEDKERKRLLKEEKAREKRIEADLAEVNKSKLDKKDSTPEMIVDIPASLDGQSVDTQIREFLRNLGVDVTVYQSPMPNIIKWRRKMKARWNAEVDHWEPIERMEIHEEKHILCIVSAKEFIELAMVQEDDQDIETHVAKLKSAHDGCTPIYLIEGLYQSMKRNKTAENRAYQAKVNSLGQPSGMPLSSQIAPKSKRSGPKVMDEDLIEDALLRLQVMSGCLVHHTATSVETAEWVANFTQHISTIPYRTQRMNLETSICMESGQVKAGEDRDDTFVKMLQEIVRITPPIAYGIASEYSNVINLVKAFRRYGPNVLEDLQKSANRNGAFTDRKIGPAISRRLYKVFTELDPASTDV